MRRALLAMLVLAAFAVVIFSMFGAPATPRVERGSVHGARGPAPTARKPRVRTVQPGKASEELKAAPVDVAESGSCDLFLVLTDEATGAPIRSVVDLYRLDIPEDEHWTRGDRLQAQFTVPPEGWWVRNLPAARFRVLVHEQRLETEDPAAFGVEGDQTRVSLAIPMPQQFEAFLVVRDPSGARVDGGEARGGGQRHELRWVMPAWLTVRKLHHPERYHHILAGGGGGGGQRASFRARAEPSIGHRMRTWRQSSKGRKLFQWWHWRKEGWTGVTLRIDQDAPGDRHYAGVSRLREPILDSIRMPDGSRAVDAGASVAMASYPVEVGRDKPDDAWRRCTINVQVKLDGFEPLAFDLAPDEDPVERTLVAAVDKN